MKSKSFVAALILLIGVNSSFLWEKVEGSFVFTILLMFLWVLLGFVFFLKLGGVLIDRIRSKRTILSTTFIGIALLLTYLYPTGMLRPENLEDPPMAIALKAGTAGCSTTITLKENYRFKESSICFGVKRAEGNFNLNGDTIRLEFDDLSIYGAHRAKAIIRLNRDSSNEGIGNLIYYRTDHDSLPMVLTLTKFDEEKIKKHEGRTMRKVTLTFTIAYPNTLILENNINHPYNFIV